MLLYSNAVPVFCPVDLCVCSGPAPTPAPLPEDDDFDDDQPLFPGQDIWIIAQINQADPYKICEMNNIDCSREPVIVAARTLLRIPNSKCTPAEDGAYDCLYYSPTSEAPSDDTGKPEPISRIQGYSGVIRTRGPPPFPYFGSFDYNTGKVLTCAEQKARSPSGTCVEDFLGAEVAYMYFILLTLYPFSADYYCMLLFHT